MAWYTQFFVHSKGPWIQVYQGLGGFLVHSMKGEIRMAYGNSPVKIPKATGKITFRKMTDKTYVLYETGRVYNPTKKNEYTAAHNDRAADSERSNTDASKREL